MLTEPCNLLNKFDLFLYMHTERHQCAVGQDWAEFSLPYSWSTVQQPLLGQGQFIIEDSRSHSDTPHSVAPLWTSDQSDAESSSWQQTTLTTDRHLALPSGIRTAVPGSEWPYTQSLVTAQLLGPALWFLTFWRRNFVLNFNTACI
jgi:hypothetical protein